MPTYPPHCLRIRLKPPPLVSMWPISCTELPWHPTYRLSTQSSSLWHNLGLSLARGLYRPWLIIHKSIFHSLGICLSSPSLKRNHSGISHSHCGLLTCLQVTATSMAISTSRPQMGTSGGEAGCLCSTLLDTHNREVHTLHRHMADLLSGAKTRTFISLPLPLHEELCNLLLTRRPAHLVM